MVRAGRRRPAVALAVENRAERPDSGGARPEVAPMEEVPPQKPSADAAGLDPGGFLAVLQI